MLADMGADVIKIEHPVGGDDSRSFSIPNREGESVYFLTVNRNKRSIAIDLKAAAGKALFLELKAPNKKPTKLQEKWLRLLREQGFAADWTDDIGHGRTLVRTHLLG
jgi:hypothetical protein